jgi:hypothetical protein
MLTAAACASSARSARTSVSSASSPPTATGRVPCAHPSPAMQATNATTRTNSAGRECLLIEPYLRCARR